MKHELVAVRYAQSLLELAEERSVTAAVYADVVAFNNTYEESRSFRLLLSSPVVPHHKKLSILEAMFGTNFNPLTLAFFKLVTTKTRENILGAIGVEFIDIYNRKNGIQVAHLTTAVPVDAALRDKISQFVAQITGAKVELKEKVDTSIIGGFLLSLGDRQIDRTIKSRLKGLKDKLIDNTYKSKL